MQFDFVIRLEFSRNLVSEDKILTLLYRFDICLMLNKYANRAICGDFSFGDSNFQRTNLCVVFLFVFLHVDLIHYKYTASRIIISLESSLFCTFFSCRNK